MIACKAKFINGSIHFHTPQVSETCTCETMPIAPVETMPITILPVDPNAKPIVIPAPSSIPNSTVYKQDGSPPFGTFTFKKPIVTYSVVQPADNTLQDLPHGHDFVVAVNAAFQTYHWFTDPNKIGFMHVPYNAGIPTNITIKMDPNDAEFLANPDVMAYCHYPNTTPAGAFTCVINSKYLYSLDGKFNFANNINQTLRHELGHGIGCVHTTDPNDIMFPFYHNSVIPTKTDIFQYQNMYGVRNIPMAIIQQWYSYDSRLLEFK